MLHSPIQIPKYVILKICSLVLRSHAEPSSLQTVELPVWALDWPTSGLIKAATVTILLAPRLLEGEV